jgi:hypothetical protein
LADSPPAAESLPSQPLPEENDVTAIILKVIADLEGLLSQQSLAALLTAGPGKIVPFSDHEARGILYSKLDEEAVIQQLQEIIAARKIRLTTNQRLILSKK